MAKKGLKISLIIVLVLVIIISLGSFVYFGFIKQTIYGIQSQYKVGDIVKFDAIAVNPDSSYCSVTAYIIRPDAATCWMCYNA